MNSAIERLLTLRVGDIMNRDVVLVQGKATIGEAAKLLASHEITGAPVVDDEGRCVGVLSVTDLALRENRVAQVGEMVAWGVNGNSRQAGSAVLPSSVDPSEHVEDHMSPVVLTIDESAPIMNAARVLCREHIHRLIIVNDQQQPVGVVSSLDLVAATIAAVEE